MTDPADALYEAAKRHARPKYPKPPKSVPYVLPRPPAKAKALRGPSPRPRRARNRYIVSQYMAGRTQASIARMLGISTARVQQICAKAVKQVPQQLRILNLKVVNSAIVDASQPGDIRDQGVGSVDYQRLTHHIIALPAMYDDLSRYQRAVVRQEYIKRQDGMCFWCACRLDADPPARIANTLIHWDRFPKGFQKHPIHLQHDHDTGLTEGAVHFRCNAVMWQEHGR